MQRPCPQNTSFRRALPTLPRPCVSPLCQEALSAESIPTLPKLPPSLPPAGDQSGLIRGAVLLPTSKHNSCPQADITPSSLGSQTAMGTGLTVESAWGCTEGSEERSLSSEQPALEQEVGHIPEENTGALS